MAAPSANRSSEISPTTADHVARSLGDRIRWIVDGGPCPVGIESTVLDLSVQPPRVLRPGMIGPAALAAALGQTPRAAGGPEERGRGPLRSPGLLDRHYAPPCWCGGGGRNRSCSNAWRRPGFRPIAAPWQPCGFPAPSGSGGRP